MFEDINLVWSVVFQFSFALWWGLKGNFTLIPYFLCSSSKNFIYMMTAFIDSWGEGQVSQDSHIKSTLSVTIVKCIFLTGFFVMEGEDSVFLEFLFSVFPDSSISPLGFFPSALSLQKTPCFHPLLPSEVFPRLPLQSLHTFKSLPWNLCSDWAELVFSIFVQRWNFSSTWFFQAPPLPNHSPQRTAVQAREKALLEFSVYFSTDKLI